MSEYNDYLTDPFIDGEQNPEEESENLYGVDTEKRDYRMPGAHMKKLQDLESFNKSRQEEYDRVTSPCRNEIACPECGAELYDSNPSQVEYYPNTPPRMKIHCVSCVFWGYRLVLI